MPLTTATAVAPWQTTCDCCWGRIAMEDRCDCAPPRPAAIDAKLMGAALTVILTASSTMNNTIVLEGIERK